jgi:long-chain-fatty-acid--CoA ligase ACSBG
LSFKIANKLVFEKVKTALGLNKCGDKFFVAAAPFNNNTFEYFLSLDIRILEIYGMSECSGPHTVNTPTEQGVGSVGQTIKGCNTKLDVDVSSSTDATTGEILMSGRHVMMGYMGNREKTDETVVDSKEGWLRTGDVGMLDSDGYLFITGRIKEIIVTAGGENVPPVPIEDDIKEELR